MRDVDKRFLIYTVFIGVSGFMLYKTLFSRFELFQLEMFLAYCGVCFFLVLRHLKVM